MTKKNYNIRNVKSIDRLKDIVIFCKRCLVLLLLLISVSQIKGQSLDVITEDIRFKSRGVSLAGTIYKPRHSYVAVVIVHGSDKQPRMREFAALLAENGISVLTYDKRGVGESGGIYAGPEVGTNNIDSANLSLLAEDANAAVNILHQRDKNVPVGLVGFSQAGWIIPIAANQNSLVDFMVLFSGSVVSTLEQLRFQFFTEGKPDFWDNHTEAEAREHICCDADRYQFANTDPYDALSTLSIPGLWLFGSKDVQIPVGLSIERLNAFKVEGKPYEYCLFSTLGHNVAFSDSTEPVSIAVHWIKERNHYMKSNTK